MVEGILDAEHFAIGVFGRPGSRCGRRGEEVTVVADLGADVSDQLRMVSLRYDGVLRLDRHHGDGVEFDPDRLAGGGAGRLDDRRASQDHGEEEGIGGAPGVERFASNAEAVVGWSRGETETNQVSRLESSPSTQFGYGVGQDLFDEVAL